MLAIMLMSTANISKYWENNLCLDYSPQSLFLYVLHLVFQEIISFLSVIK